MRRAKCQEFSRESVSARRNLVDTCVLIKICITARNIDMYQPLSTINTLCRAV